MSRIRCGIKTAKLGATVFGRRKPISKDWWIGVWPDAIEAIKSAGLEDENVEPSQSIGQRTPTASEEGYSSSRSASSGQTRNDQLAGAVRQGNTLTANEEDCSSRNDQPVGDDCLAQEDHQNGSVAGEDDYLVNNDGSAGVDQQEDSDAC